MINFILWFFLFLWVFSWVLTFVRVATSPVAQYLQSTGKLKYKYGLTDVLGILALVGLVARHW